MLLMWRHQEPLRRYTGGFSFHRYADKKRNNMPVELSPEEDELREMVKGTLETNGILNDLRVQLRTAVFHVIEENKNQRVSEPPSFLSNNGNDGMIMAQVVLEFLNFYDLKRSQSVYAPECQLNVKELDKKAIVSTLSMDTEKSGDGPILLQLITQFRQAKTMQSKTKEKSSEDDKVSLDAASVNIPSVKESPRKARSRSSSPKKGKSPKKATLLSKPTSPPKKTTSSTSLSPLKANTKDTEEAELHDLEDKLTQMETEDTTGTLKQLKESLQNELAAQESKEETKEEAKKETKEEAKEEAKEEESDEDFEDFEDDFEDEEVESDIPDEIDESLEILSDSTSMDESSPESPETASSPVTIAAAAESPAADTEDDQRDVQTSSALDDYDYIETVELA